MADVTSPFGFPYPEPTDLVRDGATDIEALAQAANDQFLAGFQFAGQRIYTSSGQFVKADPFGTGDIGLRAVRVRVQAGGGGGGGAGATDAGKVSVPSGGGGGGFAESFITDIASLPSSVTVLRGSGGAGGSGDANGNAGGVSSFDSLVAANGGAGGLRSSNFNAPFASETSASGDGTAGDLQIAGSAGKAALAAGPTPGAGHSGAGGDSVLGVGSSNRRNSGNGFIGRPHGGGGSGAMNFQSETSTRVGGAGREGIIIIDCFV